MSIAAQKAVASPTEQTELTIDAGMKQKIALAPNVEESPR
jgi:hypothetical protein